jgi:starch-binding outer membrane protein SusE/F
MKRLNNIWILALGLLVLAACEKKEDLPFFDNGVAPALTATAATLAPAVSDSNKVVLTLNWTDPEFATTTQKTKYIVQIDSSGRNFSKAVSKELVDSLSTSFLAKELNNMLLAWGFEYNKAYDIDFRVLTSYANNNDQKVSNTVKIRITTYKIPPKVAVPSSGRLFIVGDATAGGWTNPVPTPSQELTKIDSVTYGGIFNLVGGKQYLILPVNGDWGFKYSVASNTVPGLAGGGDFGANLSDNFPGPAASGLYKVVLNFQSGKFTVTPFNQQHGLPDSLFIVGDATPGGWNNPVPVPSQKFTRVNSTRFELTVALTSGKAYLFLPENGNWGKKFGAVNNLDPIKLGGPLKPEGQDMPSPDVSGNYKIVVDFINNSYTLTKL